MSKGTELVKLPEKHLKTEHLFCLSYINYKLPQPTYENKMRELKTPFCNSQWINKESKLWAAVTVNMKYRGQNMLNYTKYAVNKFQSVGNSTGQMAWVL